MTTLISLQCKQCSNHFDYAKKELTRQIKKGRSETDIFCSLSCARIYKNSHRSSEEQSKISAALSKRNIGNEYRKKGLFTFYLHKARGRNKEFNLDEEYLNDLWLKQKEICPLTGIHLELKSGKTQLDTASLDRVDSSIGYVKGNVQFVAYSANLGKCQFSDNEYKVFIAKIVAAAK